jgi:putative DNA primase/helicase
VLPAPLQEALMEIRELKRLCNGRWPSVLASLPGVEPALFNRKNQRCPHCGHKDSFRFCDWQGNGGFYCHKHEPAHGDGLDLVQLLLKVNASEAKKMVMEKMGAGLPPAPAAKNNAHDEARHLKWRVEAWKDSVPIQDGDPVDLWLRFRIGDPATIQCLLHGRWPVELRYHRHLKYWSQADGERDSYHPAMLARVLAPRPDAAGRPFHITIHRTYLTEDGRKALVTPARSFMRGLRLPKGGAIRLAPMTCEGVLAIAEGIETALAFMALYGIPCWAASDAQGLAGFIPPVGCRTLWICPDFDGFTSGFTGLAAGTQLAQRLHGERRKEMLPPDFWAHLDIPHSEGFDFNDVLNLRRNS